MISHDREPPRQGDVLHLGPYSSNQMFNNITDFVPANPPRIRVHIRVSPRDEGHLKIYLGKFRLSVLTAIFVPEATCKLIVAVNATRAHEELLGLLGRLRKSEKQGLLDFGPV